MPDSQDLTEREADANALEAYREIIWNAREWLGAPVEDY